MLTTVSGADCAGVTLFFNPPQDGMRAKSVMWVYQNVKQTKFKKNRAEEKQNV